MGMGSLSLRRPAATLRCRSERCDHCGCANHEIDASQCAHFKGGHVNRQASILIVDDDPSISRLVRSHLERGGYHARSVATGQAALDVISDRVPDLVILDPTLSSSDGYTVCAEIRSFSRVPVVMLAAKADQEDKLRG